jgi:hypothetical protein
MTLLALAAAVPLAGCSDPAGPNADRLALTFTGLEALANGYHYEGWAITPGGPVSTGKFNVGAGGSLVAVGGGAIANGEFATKVDLGTATAIAISIEPPGDVDAIPAAAKVLSGTLTGGVASLRVGGDKALGNDFMTAAGRFILATPTDGMNNNENSGIWFLDLVGGTPRQSLTLPTLPAGWIYEGWVVINGRPVTTGTFASGSGADNAKPYSGTMAGPPFPGEDFIMNAPAGLTFPTNLAGGMAVISIEPVPDDSPAPFTLKPLLGAIPAGAQAFTAYSLGLNLASFPSGTATVR